MWGNRVDDFKRFFLVIGICYVEFLIVGFVGKEREKKRGKK